MAAKPKPGLDQTIEQMLASRVPPTEVADLVITRYGISEGGAWKAIRRVRARWITAEQTTTVEERRAVFRAELGEAWRQALEAKEFKAIAAMSRVRADVEGLRMPTKIDVSGTIGLRPAAALAPDEREREIATLLAEREVAAGRPRPVLEAASEEVGVERIGGLEIPELDDGEEAPPPNLKPARKKRKRRRSPLAN